MLNMWGINLYTGGHYDNYIVNYYGYREGPAPEGTFDKPDICPDKPEPGDGLTPHHKQAGVHAQIRRMLPNPHHGEISPPPHKLLRHEYLGMASPCAISADALCVSPPE